MLRFPFTYRLFLIVLLGFISQFSFASQQVPDFTMTSIDGREVNLYQTLEEGKVVIVEVFATWCTTCWKLHKKNHLERIYSTYGPNGTGQVEIFFIEGDINTDPKELYGNGSIGNWTEGVSYPIFSPTQLPKNFIEAFAKDGVPTSNVICPETKTIIADIFQNNLSEIIEIIQECNTIANVKDVQVLSPDQNDVGVCKPSEILFQVLNTGTKLITELELNATFENGEIYNTHNCEVYLLPGKIINIDMGEYILPENIDSKLLNLNITTQDDVPENNTQSVIYSHAEKVFNRILLSIATDSWAEVDNTRWWVENSNGHYVVPETSLINNVNVEEEIFLENNDCFTFVIAEDYGDGMALGHVKLTTEDGIVLYDNSAFQTMGEANFEYLGSIASSEETLNRLGYDLNLVSNLITNDLPIQFKLPNPQKIELQILSLDGILHTAETFDANAGEQQTSLNINNLSSGIYFLQLVTEEGVLSRKFVKQ